MLHPFIVRLQGTHSEPSQILARGRGNKKGEPSISCSRANDWRALVILANHAVLEGGVRMSTTMRFLQQDCACGNESAEREKNAGMRRVRERVRALGFSLGKDKLRLLTGGRSLGGRYPPSCQ